MKHRVFIGSYPIYRKLFYGSSGMPALSHKSQVLVHGGTC